MNDLSVPNQANVDGTLSSRKVQIHMYLILYSFVNHHIQSGKILGFALFSAMGLVSIKYVSEFITRMLALPNLCESVCGRFSSTKAFSSEYSTVKTTAIRYLILSCGRYFHSLSVLFSSLCSAVNALQDFY